MTEKQIIPQDILDDSNRMYSMNLDVDPSRRKLGEAYIKGRMEERVKSSFDNTSVFHALLNVVGARDCSGEEYAQVLLPHKEGGDAIRLVFREDDIAVDRYSEADSVWTDEDMIAFARFITAPVDQKSEVWMNKALENYKKNKK